MLHPSNLKALTTLLKTFILACLIVIGTYLFNHYFILNTNRSIPIGLYQKKDTFPGKMDYVLFTLPASPIIAEVQERQMLEAGLFPPNYQRLIKRIYAGSNDTIKITEHEIFINGQAVPQTRRTVELKSSVQLPYEHKLAYDEVLLLSPHPVSFDSRYFGPLKLHAIRTVLEPILIWE